MCPAGFRPLDEREAAMLREQAQARVFAGAERDARLPTPIARVAEHVGPDGFAPLIAETARLGEALALHGDARRVRRKSSPSGWASRPARTRRPSRAAMREGGGGPRGLEDLGARRWPRARPTTRSSRRS